MTGIVALAFCFFLTAVPPAEKINWRKVDTHEQAVDVMNKCAPRESLFDDIYQKLSEMDHDFVGAEADSVILFHSPFVPVRFMSFVSRKWMYRLSF